MCSFEISNDRLGMLHGLTQDDASSTPFAQHPVRPKIPQFGSNNGNESIQVEAAESPKSAKDRSKVKFRFKKKKHRSDRGKDEKRDHHHRDGSSRPSKRRRHTHLHNEVTDDPTAYDDTYIPNVAFFKYTNSDDAFRESLFDAMADDEGAAFWEGVYGQPITGYPRPEKPNKKGRLEGMNDEEYAKYVRKKMWEKTHQHIIEEQEKRERAREHAKERERRDQEDRKQWDEAEKIRIREGKQRRERREKNRLRKCWDEYLEDWAIVMEGTRIDVDGSGNKGKRLQDLIPWPVESGKLSDISQEAVKQFFLTAPTGPELDNEELTDILKLERVRWHPDKAQQRWGKWGIGKEELKGITAVFQAIDSLWIKYKVRGEKQV